MLLLLLLSLLVTFLCRLRLVLVAWLPLGARRRQQQPRLFLYYCSYDYENDDYLPRQAVYSMITASNLVSWLSPADTTACFLAALCHDLDHPGHSNVLERSENTPLAQKYVHTPDTHMYTHVCTHTLARTQTHRHTHTCSMCKQARVETTDGWASMTCVGLDLIESDLIGLDDGMCGVLHDHGCRRAGGSDLTDRCARRPAFCIVFTACLDCPAVK
jgi:hypothetical protein